MSAVRRCDRPAVLALPLDEHLVAREVVTGDADAAVGELLEVAGLERRAHGTELLAELRPEQREVRLHAELARLDVPERDLADAELVRDLAGMALGERRALDDERAERLPQLHARGRTRLAPELDDAPQLGDLGEQRRVRLGGLRPARRDGRRPARPSHGAVSTRQR